MAVARVALPVAADRPFDYWAPESLDLRVGSVVRVRLGPRALPGVVVAWVAPEASPVERARLQPVLERIDLPALPEDVVDLAAFAAAYYQDAPGLAFALALPPLSTAAARPASLPAALCLSSAGRAALPDRLRRAPAARALFALLDERGGIDATAIGGLTPTARTTLRKWYHDGWVEAASPVPASRATPVLNERQRGAVAAIEDARGTFAPFLLQGVTGSGKSEVYFDAAARAIAAGGQVLMLVPEINLTPQLDARIGAALPGVTRVTLHSGLADGVRRANWLAAASGAASLVLGTRLAVFTPLPRLALIVVDEEHDGSFKQQDSVRYQARDLAVWRARRRSVPVVLGSATPSLESVAAVEAGRYRRLVLPQRADPRARLPAVRLVPARAEVLREGIAEPLWDALRERVARGEQSLVFVNRRGFAPALKCASCGWDAQCPRCSARLVLHRTPAGLRCHHCGHAERVPPGCPSCGNVDLLPRGHGTQRLEQALAAGLPGARVARVDRDSTSRRGSFADLRARVEAGEVDVLVGTQMLAKGHDFPRLTLVGVLGADNALYSADFRATERLAALLIQVAGRAGRADLAGEVIVQTDFPTHPVFAALVSHDVDSLAASLLEERRAAQLPPYVRLALVTAEAHERARVDRFLALAHDAARRLVEGTRVEAFPPVAALLARRAGYERGQMLLRAASAGDLQRVLQALRSELQASGRGVRWAIDVDPDSVA